MEPKLYWADFGPEYDPEKPENPNEAVFTLAVEWEWALCRIERLTRERDLARQHFENVFGRGASSAPE
jgi:hypothetical protein